MTTTAQLMKNRNCNKVGGCILLMVVEGIIIFFSENTCFHIFLNYTFQNSNTLLKSHLFKDRYLLLEERWLLILFKKDERLR